MRKRSAHKNVDTSIYYLLYVLASKFLLKVIVRNFTNMVYLLYLTTVIDPITRTRVTGYTRNPKQHDLSHNLILKPFLNG